MPILPVTVNEKIATYTGSERYICGNSDFVVELTLDDEWSKHDAKTARFVYGREYTDVVFTGNTVAVPVIEKAHEIQFGIYAGNLQTTTPAGIPCDMSIRSYNGAPNPPSPDVYDKIMDMIGNKTGIKSVEIREGYVSGEGGVGELPAYFLEITEKSGNKFTKWLPNIEVDLKQIVKMQKGRPTTETEGMENQLLINTDDWTLYVCNDVRLILGAYRYDWQQIGGAPDEDGGSGGENEDSESGRLTVDDALSETSINPVQNKVVTAEFHKLEAEMQNKQPADFVVSVDSYGVADKSWYDIYAARQEGRRVYLINSVGLRFEYIGEGYDYSIFEHREAERVTKAELYDYTNEVRYSYTQLVKKEHLASAVEDALEQAKESGGFDGAPGTTPHIGGNGNWYIGETDTGVRAQGDDYVLTTADKTEIAQQAAGLVDTALLSIIGSGEVTS